MIYAPAWMDPTNVHLCLSVPFNNPGYIERWCALSRSSTGRATQKIDDLLWFFAVGLSGRDGMERQRKWPMKTLPILLKENGHTEAGLFLFRRDAKHRA